jgi:RNA polymerase sigma factor (sigma-70 family)
MADIRKNDSELINDFKNGDIRGFNEIVRKYQQQVYWVIRRMVIDHDDADDITQEVFVKVYSALKNFREEANLFTWLYRIATNYSINHIRKIKSKNLVSFEVISDPIETKEKGSEEIIDEETRRKVLNKAIESLPVQQKAVFNLRYYEELSYEEIAKIMKKSVGGIKANYFHAVKNLSSYFKAKMIVDL